ncbi:unnamed protein product [Sympodiomycopsis kandeliae]
MASTSSAPIFKKKRSRGNNGTTSSTNGGTAKSQPLKRINIGNNDEDDDEDPSSSAGPSIVHKVRKVDASNPLTSSTGISLAKQRAKARAEQEDQDDLEETDEYTTVSARAKSGSSSNDIRNRLGADATRSVEWYDEDDNKKKSSSTSQEAKNNDDGVYRGLSNYSSAVNQDDAKSNKYSQRGPIKAPSNIRTVTVVDYQPDVCKDYKETGYCGFGDTCKFLHDRSDYLAGWQMEAAYLPNSTARNLDHGAGQGDDEEEEEEEEIPFACLICRQPFTDPVQTKCGHYFCSACAIKRFSKTPKCFACGAQTGGIFNNAHKIIKRMEKTRDEKEQAKRKRRAEWGEDTGAEQQGDILEGVDIANGSDGEHSDNGKV